MTAETFFDAARALKRELTGEPAGLVQDEVDALNAVISAWERRGEARGGSGPATPDGPEARADGPLTARVALEIIGHEAIVREAYLDSVDVWTWGIGVTNASGHTVYPRYKDNPQPLEHCLKIFMWLLLTRYIPAVEKAFAGHELSEAQFAAALSFHYNTGAIARADWVRHFRDGRSDLAEAAIMNWRTPPEIIPRRQKERDLFFDGRWSSDGKATVYPVKKPSYRPDFRRGERVDVRQIVEGLLA